mmetsp:Transcript_850/g.2108  ORF Transcript_850/g.2108 Transcript_850/m.2108 type:complete len:170 (-) Transcript_850:82-591(-)
MSNDEIQSRIKCVQNWKRQMDDVRADLTGGFGKTSSKGSREALLGSKQEQEERAKAKKALERDNQEFMEGEGMRQQLIHEELNVYLDDLHTSVTRLGEMGLTIHHELKEQEAIVDDLTERTDANHSNMLDINKQVSDLLKSRQGRNQLLLIAGLILALLVVVALIFILP